MKYHFLLAIVCILFLFPASKIFADTLVDQSNVSSDYLPLAFSSSASHVGAQTFTASATYTPTYINLAILNDNVTSTTISFALYNAVAGMPNGSALCSNSVSSNYPTVGLNPPPVVFTITLSGCPTINYGQTYVMTWFANSDGLLVYGSLSNPYSGGELIYSTNTGSSWTTGTGDDIFFQVYGTSVVFPSTGDTLELPTFSSEGGSCDVSQVCYFDWLLMNSFILFFLSLICFYPLVKLMFPRRNF